MVGEGPRATLRSWGHVLPPEDSMGLGRVREMNPLTGTESHADKILTGCLQPPREHYSLIKTSDQWQP